MGSETEKQGLLSNSCGHNNISANAVRLTCARMWQYDVLLCIGQLNELAIYNAFVGHRAKNNTAPKTGQLGTAQRINFSVTSQF
jgi:hypothetical protein